MYPPPLRIKVAHSPWGAARPVPQRALRDPAGIAREKPRLLICLFGAFIALVGQLLIWCKSPEVGSVATYAFMLGAPAPRSMRVCVRVCVSVCWRAVGGVAHIQVLLQSDRTGCK
eukprot:gene11319-biopygen1124